VTVVVERKPSIRELADFLLATRRNYEKAVKRMDDASVMLHFMQNYVDCTYNLLKWVLRNYSESEVAFLFYVLIGGIGNRHSTIIIENG